MNKYALLALAVVGACALAAEAGRIENKEELEGARSAFGKNLKFFSELIEKNGKEAQAAQQPAAPAKPDTFEDKLGRFQGSIDSNPGAPIPRPLNKEVDVYLRDGEDANEDEHEDAHLENLNLGGLFSE